MRTEKDFLGTMELEDHVLYGIHSLRAVGNFPDRTPFSEKWFRALGTVKKACYHTYKKFSRAVTDKYGRSQQVYELIPEQKLEAMMVAAGEIESGMHFDQLIVPAIQGGAGTSINMNVNEIIANRALQIMGHKPGEYHILDPIEQGNIFQSTNDVIPTSLKVCIMSLLNDLEDSINRLRSSVEKVEKDTQAALRIAYTQMQPAVPSSYGRLFSTYNDALSRDWWRTSKCSERIKVVNLGGSAIGTGITVPRFFIHEVIHTLQDLTGFPITRGENLQDATANLDPFVEIHAILKAHAVNLEKMVSDLRLLSSGLLCNTEVQIPQRQAGSSVMPGKVNPVIPEFVISCVHKLYTNDQLISGLCGQGCLDLNPYLPVIGNACIDSLQLLIACNQAVHANMMDGIRINSAQAEQNMYMSASVATALLPYIGYHKAGLLADEMKKHSISIQEANKRLGLLDASRLQTILEPANLLKEGFSLNDITGQNEREGT